MDINHFTKKNNKSTKKIDNSKKNNKKDQFSNPYNLQLFNNDVVNDSYSWGNWLNNSFTFFKSINGIIYLIYSNANKSLIFYDFVNFKKIIEIKNAHKENISTIKHFLDEVNKKDLIMSISRKNDDIKIWNAYNCECIVNIKGMIASFLKDNNQIYIVTSRLEIFDLKGDKIKDIHDNKHSIPISLDIYYENNFSKIFIITSDSGFVKSYDYNKNKIYHNYQIGNNHDDHCSFVIKSKGKYEKQLIESCTDGNIMIWNFHSGELLNTINVSDKDLFDICLWNNDYLFVGCEEEHLIKLIDLQLNKVIKNFYGHKENVTTIKKIIHPQYGECLISKGGYSDKFKLWINKNLTFN